MDRVAILDTSALMALIRGENGADKVAACIAGSLISTVNLAEVHSKLVLAGLDEKLAWWHIDGAECSTVPFDDYQARMAGGLVLVTKPFGLSLGDRACLALAIQQKGTIYTADKIWKKIPLGIEVEVIR